MRKVFGANLLIIIGLVFFTGCSFSSLPLIEKKPDFYMIKDYKNKKRFADSKSFTNLYRCEETKKDFCLLFDKDGDYIKLDKKINPDSCFRIRGNLYCPLPKLELEEDQEEVVVNPIVKEDSKLSKLEKAVREQTRELQEEEEELKEEKIELQVKIEDLKEDQEDLKESDAPKRWEKAWHNFWK